MFRHVVLFKWAEGTTREQVETLLAEIGKLPGEIGTIRDFRYGPDAGINPANSDFAVVADFDDQEGYLAYRDHPAHRGLVDRYITPILSGRAAVQFESGGAA